MRFKISCFLASFFFVSVSCGPPPLPENLYKRNNFYPQASTYDVALLVLEQAERRPGIIASGYLADRRRGIFYTAKHFTDDFGSLGPNYCKVFFNGKVYTARIIKVPPIRDATLIRINSPFSYDEFPEPLPIAKNKPKLEDKIFIQGLHPHPYIIRQENESEGFPDKVVPIFETYYGTMEKDLNRETQVVFDNLEGKKVKPDPDSIRNNSWLNSKEKNELLEYENNLYIKVLATRDHKFSFGGLSGGVALNDKREIIGIITAQNPLKLELDEYGFFIPGRGELKVANIKKEIFDTLYVTPIEAIEDLQKFIKETR